MSQEPSTEATLGRGALRSLLDPQATAIAPMVASEIQAALEQLPDDHRTVVILADVEELSYKEIAEVMGCPIGTVMSRLHRARKALQERLSDHAESLGLKPALLPASAGATPALAAAGTTGGESRPISLASYRRERSRG